MQIWRQSKYVVRNSYSFDNLKLLNVGQVAPCIQNKRYSPIAIHLLMSVFALKKF